MHVCEIVPGSINQLYSAITKVWYNKLCQMVNNKIIPKVL